MTDIAQGVGFDTSNLPSYDDLVQKLGASDTLEKASQALQTLQLTHSVLSNYKPYRDLTKSLSEAVFDPVKAKFEKTVSETVAKVAGKFNPTGEGDGVASKLIKLAGDNPEDLLKLVKNPKAGAKSLLKKAIDSSDLSAEDKAFAKAASEGKIAPKTIAKKALQKVIDSSDIPDEAKALAKSAAEGKLPNTQDAKNLLGNIIDKADIPDDVKALAKAASSGSRKTFMNAAKDNIGKAIDNSNLPDDVKATAKTAISGGNLTDEAKSALNTAIDNSDLAPEIKSFSKAIVLGNKQNLADQVSSTLNGIVEKSNLSPEVQNLAKTAAKGRAPTLDEAKSAMDAVIPDSVKAQLPKLGAMSEDIAQLPSQVTAKAKAFAELPKMGAAAVEKSVGKMPAELVSNLRQAGVSDEEMAANKSVDFAKIAKQAPLRLLDPSEISADAPDFDLADAQRSYRASKYLERLSKPAADTGMGPGGDSTLARLFKEEEPVKDIKQYAPKTKRDIKEQAKQRKMPKKQPQEEAGPAEEQPRTTSGVVETQTINQNRELADEALTPYIEKLSAPPKATASEIEPAPPAEPKPVSKVPITEEEGLSAGDIAGGAADIGGTALGAFGLAQSIEQKNKPQEVLQGTQLAAGEGGDALMAVGEATAKEGAAAGGEIATKAVSTAGKLQAATDESLAGDEDPIGAGISAVLEIATLATMLGGIFAPKPKQPVIVGGYQSGV